MQFILLRSLTLRLPQLYLIQLNYFKTFQKFLCLLTLKYTFYIYIYIYIYIMKNNFKNLKLPILL